MHIPDGVLPIAVAATGYGVTGAATWYALRKINEAEDPREHIPKAALLTAAFFVASWVHIPLPPTSVHLVLNGLLGVMLGYFAFPAILIGLLFQAIMFQHGGLTTLGINAAMMGIPALLAYGVFQARGWLRLPDTRHITALFGFMGGAAAIGLSITIFYALIIMTIPTDIDLATERAAVTALALAHIPLMIIEGTLTAMLVLFLSRVKPHLVGNIHAPARA